MEQSNLYLILTRLYFPRALFYLLSQRYGAENPKTMQKKRKKQTKKGSVVLHWFSASLWCFFLPPGTLWLLQNCVDGGWCDPFLKSNFKGLGFQKLGPHDYHRNDKLSLDLPQHFTQRTSSACVVNLRAISPTVTVWSCLWGAAFKGKSRLKFR